MESDWAEFCPLFLAEIGQEQQSAIGWSGVADPFEFFYRGTMAHMSGQTRPSPRKIDGSATPAKQLSRPCSRTSRARPQAPARAATQVDMSLTVITAATPLDSEVAAA